MGRSEIPYCIVAKVVFSSLRTMSVSEKQAEWLVDFGWHVLIRDSQLTPEEPPPMQSGTDRRMWMRDDDIQREIGED